MRQCRCTTSCWYVDTCIYKVNLSTNWNIGCPDILTVRQNVSQRCKEEEANIKVRQSRRAIPRGTNATIFERDDPSFPYRSGCSCVYGSCHWIFDGYCTCFIFINRDNIRCTRVSVFLPLHGCERYMCSAYAHRQRLL